MVPPKLSVRRRNLTSLQLDYTKTKVRSIENPRGSCFVGARRTSGQIFDAPELAAITKDVEALMTLRPIKADSVDSLGSVDSIAARASAENWVVTPQPIWERPPASGLPA
jgi:hypothetical protein